MAMANAPAADNAALIADLRPRLKVPRSTGVPGAEHVGLALRVKTKGFWPEHIQGATRTRIKRLAARMVDEGHLAAAELAFGTANGACATLTA